MLSKTAAFNGNINNGHISSPATASSRMASPPAAATAASAEFRKAHLSPVDQKDLQLLPGYGNGFKTTENISEAVEVLGPLVKVFGPHLGRDPVMFARVREREGGGEGRGGYFFQNTTFFPFRFTAGNGILYRNRE